MPPRAASVASRAFLDAALAQIGKEAGEDCREVRGRRRRDIDLPRGVKVQLRLGMRNCALRGAVSIRGVSAARPLFAVDPGDVRLASESGGTADIQESSRRSRHRRNAPFQGVLDAGERHVAA
jgi:hypothetical protein